MASYNFCPYCGHKIEGNPKFCAECGKPLTSSSASEQTSSKLGKGFSSLFNKVSKTATGLTSKVKETLNEKKEASKRSAKISVLDTAASNEYTVANIPAEYGDGLLKESVTLSITNKAILIYGKRSSLNKKDGLQLMLRINLADISEIYKEKSIYNDFTEKISNYFTPVCPKPPSPLSVSDSSSTETTSSISAFAKRANTN